MELSVELESTKEVSSCDCNIRTVNIQINVSQGIITKACDSSIFTVAISKYKRMATLSEVCFIAGTLKQA